MLASVVVILMGCCAGLLSPAGAPMPRQRMDSAGAGDTLTRCLKSFYLGSPLYRTIVGTLAGVGLILFIVGLALATQRIDVGAKWVLVCTAIIVCLMGVTLLCATPSGAATQFFKVISMSFTADLLLSPHDDFPCILQTVVPVTATVSFVITLAVAVICSTCSWVIYPALLFALMMGTLVLARLQLLAASVPDTTHRAPAHASLPEQAVTAAQLAAEKAKQKRKDLNMPVCLIALRET